MDPLNQIQQRKLMIEKVLAELKQQTGIDYLKLFTGDKKEKRKARLQDYLDMWIR